MRKRFIGLFLFSFLIISATCYAEVLELNFNKLKIVTREMIQDNNPQVDLRHHSEVKLSTYINIAQQEIAIATWCLEKTTYYNIISGQRNYNWLDDMITIQRITTNGTLLPATSIEQLDEKGASWETETSSSAPSYYFVNHTTYSYLGFDVIPDTDTYTELKIQYVAMPDILVNENDVPFNGIARLSSYHFLIPLWVSAFISYQDNNNTEGDRFLLLYKDGIKNMEQIIRIKADYTESFGGRRK